MTEAIPAELVLCDTTFVGLLSQRQPHPERFGHWPDDTVERIDKAILAVSVITLAEARYGYLKANWGQARIEREEQRLQALVLIPLDPTILDEWARLKLKSNEGGWSLSDNDLWIAATAAARSVPLVTCDRDHMGINDERLEVIYLPRTPDSGA